MFGRKRQAKIEGGVQRKSFAVKSKKDNDSQAFTYRTSPGDACPLMGKGNGGGR